LLRRLLVAAALTGSVLVAPLALAPASAATIQVSEASAACTYGRSGNHWNCITPGAYCPKAAHYRYGYAKVTNRRYKCSIYSNGAWRWKRV